MKRWSLGGKLSLKDWTRGERLTLCGLVISFASLAVAVVGAYGDHARTAAPPAQEERIAVIVAQSLVTTALSDVLKKASEPADAERAAEAVRSSEAARLRETAAKALPAVEVAKVSRKRGSSRKSGVVPGIDSRSWVSPVEEVTGRRRRVVMDFDPVAGYTPRYAHPYATGGAPVYADIGGPVSHQARTFSAPVVDYYVPPPEKRVPGGLLGPLFRFFEKNRIKGFDQLLIIGLIFYFGYWIVVCAGKLLMITAGGVAAHFKRGAHTKP